MSRQYPHPVFPLAEDPAFWRGRGRVGVGVSEKLMGSSENLDDVPYREEQNDNTKYQLYGFGWKVFL